MAKQGVKTHRYVLEKSVSRAPADVRTFRPAMVSVIGNEPVAEFEEFLKGLNYDPGRFGTSEYYKSAATWKKWGNFKLPTGAMALLFITTESEAVLEALGSEIAQYEGARGTLLIAWPGRTHFGRQMMNQLAEANCAGHFIRLGNSQTIQREPTGGCWRLRIKRYIEALLIADTYPGMLWLDPLAIMTSFNARRQSTRVFHFEGRTFKKLMASVTIDRRSKSDYPTVLATLFGPSSLKLAHVGDVTRFLNETLPDAAPVIFAPFADAMRKKYTLYLTILE